MEFKRNILLAQYTSWRVGGPAKFFVEVTSTDELKDVIAESLKKNIPFKLLGGGTNVLISDKGYEGLIIRNKSDSFKIVGFTGKGKGGAEGLTINSVFIRTDAGVLVNRLVRYTLDQGLSGLENFLGQPGTVGGAVYINAHNMKARDFFGNHITEAQILTSSGAIQTVSKEYFKFGYDLSYLQTSEDIVLSITLLLSKSKEGKVGVWEKANAVMQYRMQTQPKGFATAGCTFRNISPSDAFRLGTPNHTQSAGYLLEAVGLKGKQIGGARISEQHANFIVNTGTATAKDIKDLITLSKRLVFSKFGVQLKEEIVYIGED